MSSLDNLAAVCADLQAVVALGVQRIQSLAHDLAAARTQPADPGTIDQISAALHASAEQLRSALAATDPSQPQS